MFMYDCMHACMYESAIEARGQGQMSSTILYLVWDRVSPCIWRALIGQIG